MLREGRSNDESEVDCCCSMQMAMWTDYVGRRKFRQLLYVTKVQRLSRVAQFDVIGQAPVALILMQICTAGYS